MSDQGVLSFEPTQAELRAAMVERAAKRGLRVATRSEAEYLGSDQLYKSNLGGPCFVLVKDHGPTEETNG